MARIQGDDLSVDRSIGLSEGGTSTHEAEEKMGCEISLEGSRGDLIESSPRARE